MRTEGFTLTTPELISSVASTAAFSSSSSSGVCGWANQSLDSADLRNTHNIKYVILVLIIMVLEMMGLGLIRVSAGGFKMGYGGLSVGVTLAWGSCFFFRCLARFVVFAEYSILQRHGFTHHFSKIQNISTLCICNQVGSGYPCCPDC